jgi:hypothetical protein
MEGLNSAATYSHTTSKSSTQRRSSGGRAPNANAMEWLMDSFERFDNPSQLPGQQPTLRLFESFF